MGNEKKVIPLHSPFLPKSIIPEVVKTLESGWINEGQKVVDFEREFKLKFGCSNVLAVNSCTSALHLAYIIAGIKRGMEVITTPYTMEATNLPILYQGGTIVFADVNYNDGNIDPYDVEKRITKRTKAIVCVHLSGYVCDMDELWSIGKSYNIPIIEDCAQAIGAMYKGNYLGRLSDIACFSFQAIKQITTGDGGMIVTKNDSWADEARLYRWYGMEKKTRYSARITKLGYKYNMNDITATIGLEQMKHLDRILKIRREIAKFYRDELETVKYIELIERKYDRSSACWVFPIHVRNIDRFLEKMRIMGIGSSVVARRNDEHCIFGGREDLPNVDKIEKDLACLPNHCNLTDDDLHYIVKVIKKGW